MPLDEPFGKFTPPPKIPGDSSFDERHRASSADSGAGLRAVQDFLRKYREVDIETADGQIATCLVRRIRPKTAVESTDWFAVTNISTDSAFRVKVNEGRLLVPDTAGVGSDPPTVTGLAVELPVTGAELDVTDGAIIYVKVTTEHPAAAVFSVTAEDDDYVSVTVAMDVHRFYALSGELVALTAAPAPSATESFVTVAEISITDGKMNIMPRRGAITVPAIVTPVLKTASVTSALTTASYWTCNAGTAEEVTFVVPS